MSCMDSFVDGQSLMVFTSRICHFPGSQQELTSRLLGLGRLCAQFWPRRVSRNATNRLEQG